VVTYTVHEREDESGDIQDRADKIVFVKEGYAWIALVMPVLWLLYHGMWLVLTGFVALVVAFQVVFSVSGIGEDVAGPATFVISAMFALLANDLRRWTLGLRGYRLVEPVSGRDLEECEERFFTDWLAAQGNPTEGIKHVQKHSGVQAGPVPARTATEDVIGLFPEPGR
jgi:hypothetical protein